MKSSGYECFVSTLALVQICLQCKLEARVFWGKFIEFAGGYEKIMSFLENLAQ